jgi:hypothetical protein
MAGLRKGAGFVYGQWLSDTATGPADLRNLQWNFERVGCCFAFDFCGVAAAFLVYAPTAAYDPSASNENATNARR